MPRPSTRTTTARKSAASRGGQEPAVEEPKQSKSERTRARILDAAATVLADRGFAGTRLSEVAERAQIQAPAIYYHFDSREALIQEVMTAGISHLVNRVEEALAGLDDAASPLERIDVAVRTHLQVQLDESEYARAAVRNSQQVPPELRVEYDRLAQQYGTLWTSLVTRALESGELGRRLDARATAHLVLGALNATPEWWRPRQMRAERLVQETQQFVRAALIG